MAGRWSRNTYRTAPAIVTAVNNRNDADIVYDHVYTVLLEAAGLIDTGRNEEAVAIHHGMDDELRVLVGGVL